MAKNKLTLKNDVIFKEFFSRNGNEKYLKDFLSALLEINITKIEIARDVSLERLSIEEKLGILDLQAVIDDKMIVSIEMQMRDEKDMIRRSGFYGAKEIASEAKKGEQYKELKKVIMVNILDFNQTEYEEYKWEGITVIKEHREKELETGIHYYYIELPKFRKQRKDMEDKVNQWIAFIDQEERGIIEMAKEKNEMIKEAEKELEYLTGDEEVKRMAFLHEKWERDYISGIENAREEGEEKGKKEGAKEGEKRKAREIAKKMKQENLPEEMIIEITGLTKQEIKEI